MSIWAESFVFDNKTTEEYNIRLCSFDGGYPEGKSGSSIEFTKTSNPVCKRWFKTGNAKYTEALAFDTHVCKHDFSTFDSYEIEAIERWLIRMDEYKDFMFIQPDYSDVHFKVMVSNIEYVGSGETYGMKIHWICDAPFGYANKMKYKFKCPNAENNFMIYDNSGEIGYIYPDMSIKINEAGIFKFYNDIEDREFEIKNCTLNEVIRIDGYLKQISTTNTSHKIYNDCNFKFPRIANNFTTRKNNIKVTGKCDIEISYWPIKKVGV